MSHYDFTENDAGVELDSPIRDQDGPVALVTPPDTVNFRFWFDGDEAAARVRTAVVVQLDPAVVRYVTQPGDINDHGVFWGQWELAIVSLGRQITTFPIRYDVAPLIGP